MHIHGTAVTIENSKYTLLFTSMTYRDWVYYLDADVLYTPAALRYLFHTYVSECFAEDLDSDKNVLDDTRRCIDVDEIITKFKPGHIQKILDLFLSKSGFNSPEVFDTQLVAATDGFRTHLGIYDLFLFVNLSTAEYLQMLQEPAETRVRVIAGLQAKLGLDVKARIDDTQKNKEHNIPLDLTSSDEVYERRIEALGFQRVGGAGVKPAKRLPPEAESVIEQSQQDTFSEATRRLQERLRRDKQTPRKTFDWRSDEGDYIGDDVETDTSALNASPR